MGYNTFLLCVQPVELQSHPPSCFTWEVLLFSWEGLNVEMPQNMRHVHSQECSSSHKEPWE